jgi:hypothetical protein
MKPVPKATCTARVMHGPRRARRLAARTAAVIIAAATVALLAACSGSPSSAGAGAAPRAGGSTSAGGATGSTSAVAYSDCMRSHGVPKYPDPGSNGEVPKGSAQQFGVSNSQFQAAQSDCQHRLPSGGSLQQQAQQCFNAGECPAALVQQLLAAQRRFAQCMRSHGVPNWPDPTVGSEGRPIFNLIPAGITHSQEHLPPITTTMTECQRLDPAPAAIESN